MAMRELIKLNPIAFSGSSDSELLLLSLPTHLSAMSGDENMKNTRNINKARAENHLLNETEAMERNYRHRVRQFSLA
jgi:hypothetical protein